jgi:hypothetical protein
MGSYLPPGAGFGAMFDQGDPETGKRGKSIKTQHMGTVVGKRGAGNSQITGGDQGAHSLNHYGKGGLPGLEDV